MLDCGLLAHISPINTYLRSIFLLNVVHFRFFVGVCRIELFCYPARYRQDMLDSRKIPSHADSGVY
jgi:hypothetical protein